MISIIVTSVGHFEEHVVPLYKSFKAHGDFEFILSIANPGDIRSRAELTNGGLASATGDWLITMDNDIRCNGSFGFINNLDTKTLYGLKRLLFNDNWLCEQCIAIPRGLYEEIGGFDENFQTSMSFGGVDYCIRAMEAGYKTDELVAPFKHLAAATKLDNPEHERTRKENETYLKGKWPGK